MAGDWIKVEVALPDKPEVWRIAGILGIDPDAVVGKLLKVWRWFDAHTENGNADYVTFSLVDSKAGVNGFAEAMCMCGWLEQKGSSLSLPNFDRHNGKTAKNRAQTAVRVANHKEKGNADGNAENVSDALPREEKRREEKKEQKQEKNSSPIGSRLAPDWVLPGDWKVWAEQERPDLDVFTQAASFADYWHGVAGAKGRKADWLATWRNWIRNSNSGSRPRSGPAFPPQKSKALQAIEKLQGINNGLAQNGNQHRVIEADIARIGMGSGDGRDGRYGGGVDGSIDP